MARKCEKCMRGRAQVMVEHEDGPQEYVCSRCYAHVATLILEAEGELEAN